MSDKRMTPEDVVGQVRSGMTIGIGGWGSRRKPMHLVRALLRSDVKDLTVVTFGGPDIGLLCAAGKVRRAVYAFVADDVVGPTNKHSPVLEPHFRKARQAGTIETSPMTRAWCCSACKRPPGGCRSCRRASAWGPTCFVTTRA